MCSQSYAAECSLGRAIGVTLVDVSLALSQKTLEWPESL